MQSTPHFRSFQPLMSNKLRVSNARSTCAAVGTLEGRPGVRSSCGYHVDLLTSNLETQTRNTARHLQLYAAGIPCPVKQLEDLVTTLIEEAAIIGFIKWHHRSLRT